MLEHETEISNIEVINSLRLLKKYATRKWEHAYAILMDFNIPPGEEAQSAFETVVTDASERTWRDYLPNPPYFEALERIAEESNLEWDLWDGGPAIEKESYIDLKFRGLLEKQIIGALKAAINDHGPITKENACSAAKRIIGTIKDYNHKIKIKSS